MQLNWILTRLLRILRRFLKVLKRRLRKPRVPRILRTRLRMRPRKRVMILQKH
jgi:hypothetical protein